MDIFNFLKDHWTVLSAVTILVFTLGKIMQKMRTYLDKEQVDEIIEKKFANHCPYSDKIKQLETIQIKSVDDVVHIKTKLDQIDFNVQNICDKLDVVYIGKKNGG